MGDLPSDPTLITTPKEFSDALTAVRIRAGLSIRELARNLEKKSPERASVATLGGWFGGRHLPTPKLDPVLFALLAECGIDDPDELERWRAALSRVRTPPGPRRTRTPPFQGLAAYEPEHAEFFFGREALIADLADLLVRSSARGCPAIVVGPSGSGKSSLLRAGLVPVLDREYLIFTPGDHPVSEFAHHRSALEKRSIELIVVDQFEELFTSCKDEAERTIFVEILCEAASASTAPAVMIVLVMRADFYIHALRIPQLVPIMQDCQLVVGPMSESGLRQVIIEPARRCGMTIEPGLVEVLLRDLTSHDLTSRGTGRYEAGTLPLLSHALRATWEQAGGRVMTLQHYRAAGTIRDAVRNTAEIAMADLSPEQEDTARRLFLRLVEGNDTRRRITHTDLLADCTDEEADTILAVLNRFVTARLITVDDESIEITHEALLTAWPRLVGWLEADTTWRRLHHRLAAAAQDWQEAADSLYRGGILQIMLENVESRERFQQLTPLERDFLAASAAQRAAEDQADRRRTRRRQQFGALLAVLVLLAAGVSVYARQLDVTQRRNQAQALSRSVADEADRLRSSDIPLSMQLALAAYRISATPEARSSLLDSTGVPAAWRLRSTAGPITSMTATADGRLLAAGTGSGVLQLWANGHSERPIPLAGPIRSLAVSKSILVASEGDDRLHLWNIADPKRPSALGSLSAPGQTVNSVAISDDGRLVAAATGDTVTLWAVQDGLPETLSGATQTVMAVAFSSDGHTLAAGGDDSTVHLWNVADPAHSVALPVLQGSASKVFCVAFSPDGRYLAAGTSEEHNVYLWNLTDPRHPVQSGPPLNGPASWINTVTFSPDGTTLAVGSSDGLLWLYNLRTRQPVEQLPHPNPVVGVVHLSANSLITLADDGTIRGWTLPGPIMVGAKDGVFALSFDSTGRKLGVGPGAEDNTLTVWNPSDLQRPVRVGAPLVNPSDAAKFSGSGALTPDGRTFAVGDVKGGVQLWDIADPGRPHRIGAPLAVARELVEAVTVSANGRLLAISSDDGTVHLVDIANPARPQIVGVLRAPGAPLVYQSSFSPSGTLMAAAGSHQTAYLWDIRNPAKPRLLSTFGGFTSDAYATAFDHDGHLLAVSSADGTAGIWDITDPAHPERLGRPLTGPVGYVYTVAFAPRQDILAEGGTDGTVWLWDLADPRHPRHLVTLTGPTKQVLIVAFSPNGGTLAAGGLDRDVRLWDIDARTAAERICAEAGQTVTRQEWSRYIPGRAYDPPCR